jgi:hypothetical protein
MFLQPAMEVSMVLVELKITKNYFKNNDFGGTCFSCLLYPSSNFDALAWNRNAQLGMSRRFLG